MSDTNRIDLDEQRSLGAIVATTARVYQRFPLLFAILALMVMAPYELLALAITGYGPLRHTHVNGGIELLLSLLRVALITPLISALHMHAVVAVGEQRVPRLAVVIRRGLAVLPVVAAAAIMSGLGIAAGFVALIIPGIVLSLRWAVVAQAASVEQGGWNDALHSSRLLTTGNYGRTFALWVLVAAVGFAVHRGALAVSLGSSSGAASVAVGIAVDSVIASLGALVLALFYFDLRARQAAAPDGLTSS